MKSVIFLIIVLLTIVIFVTSCVSQQTYNQLQQEYNLVTDNLSGTQKQLSQVQSDLEQTKADLKKAQSDLQLYKDTFVPQGVIVDSGINDFANSGIESFNNPDAHNPTLQELKYFLSYPGEGLNTGNVSNFVGDSLSLYNAYEPSDCAIYAQVLRNDAELRNIRAAVVVIRFQGCFILHAVNAFVVKDYGLTFVDASQDGVKLSLQIGKPLTGDFSLVMNSDGSLTFLNACLGVAIPQEIDICW